MIATTMHASYGTGGKKWNIAKSGTFSERDGLAAGVKQTSLLRRTSVQIYDEGDSTMVGHLPWHKLLLLYSFFAKTQHLVNN